MKKWAVLILVFCFASAAYANPAVSPIDNAHYIIVLGSALGVEVALITIILFFCHMEPVHSFFALLSGNLALYFFLFQPVWSAFDNLLAAEAVIVAADGAYIKMLSSFDTFQADDFKGLKWRTAFICSAAGNALSYYIGTVIGA